ncbi:MAG: type IX secretion system sortase PorU [Bacteroidetes bacterium]|jgi:hypothetical protein|nr:type IX secretion system sortase PorU [Bacteroidota bacterium]
MKATITTIIFVITGLFLSIHSQSLTAKITVTDTIAVNWQANQQLTLKMGGIAQVLYFDEAITQYETASLPWQITLLSLSKAKQAEDLQLTIISADTLAFHSVRQVADIDFVSSDFELEMQDIDGNSYAKVLPLKVENGNLIRLLEYQISYSVTDKQLENSDDDPDWKNNSVLATGRWYKIGVTETGVYKLDYNAIQQMGLDPAELQPQHFGLFGNGTGMLPEENRLARADDLIENAVYIHGAEDGSFDPEDYLLFYGEDPVKWKYNLFTGKYDHKVNYFSDTTIYFFTPDLSYNGKRISRQEQSTANPNLILNSFPDYQVHEEDHESLILSGKEWFGEVLTASDPIATIPFVFPNLITEKPIQIYAKYAGRSVSEDTYFNLLANGQLVEDSAKIFQLSSNNPMYARDKFVAKNLSVDASEINIQAQIIAQEMDSRIWLDFVRINAWRALTVTDQTLSFRYPHTDTLPDVIGYEIQNMEADHLIWDVSTFHTVKSQEFTLTGNTGRFNMQTSSAKEYFLFSQEAAQSPASVYPIDNQNLHSLQQAEMLVITHPRFIDQANEIAQLHQTVDQMDVAVADVMEIYNEFGGGKPDATAVRDFIRMVYFRSNQQLKYVLLFGDASYDYKDRVLSNTNLVPTYQANSSLIETQSFVSDDYFGLMDASEGYNMAGILDIGTGRFPVSKVEDAQAMVDKVRHYMSQQEELTGQWRNNITFIGDDRDNNLHFDQAETLSRHVDTARANMNLSKIYLDAYPRVTVAGGYRYPEANKAFVKQIQDGALIINYTGHGGVNGLSDERVFTISDINGLTNIDNMPFFITATCEFSRFDNPGFVSAGEQLLLNPNGGGIALMTTTRLAFAHSNFAINKKVYAAMFDRSDVSFKRLGDVIRLSKNPTSSSVYNFALLGDPALRLVYPENTVTTTRINDQALGEVEIILHAMSEIAIEGEILKESGSVDTEFNGYLYPKMFDKKTTYKTLGNASNSRVVPFSYYEKLLYSGKITVKNGKFSFRFQLPRDIAFQYGKAKLSYYAVDTVNFTDATGYFDLFELGGTDPDIQPDDEGPAISLFINDASFQNGDIVPSNNNLFIHLNDPQGIHHLGNSIGRDIVLRYESPDDGSKILNSWFVPTTDHFGSGSISYPLNDLKDGQYQLELKAWDLHNNSSTAEILFVVDSKAKLDLHRVINYPNPFSDATAFVFDHNKPQSVFDYELAIYALDGRQIVTLSGETGTAGTRSEPIYWDARDAQGHKIPAGMYIYRLLLTDEQGIQNAVNHNFIRIEN